MDDELAALAGRALHLDAAAVRLDDPVDETEAEPGPLNLRGDHVGGAVERLEDAGLLRGRNAEPAIGDADADLVSGVRGAHANPPPCGAVLDGIADEVLEHTAESGFVTSHRRQIVRDVDLDVDTRAFDQRGRRAQHLIDEAGDIDRPRLEAPLPRLDTGELENLLDYLRQPASLAAHQ